MIYFKKIYIDNSDKSETIKAIRKFASRRDSSLDLVSSGALAGTDRLFLGAERTEQIDFTRIRYYIEDLLPKVIISFPVAEADNYYKFRFSFRTTLVACAITILLILGCVASIINNTPDAFIVFAAVFIFFCLLILLEIKLVKRAIAKAIERSKTITI